LAMVIGGDFKGGAAMFGAGLKDAIIGGAITALAVGTGGGSTAAGVAAGALSKTAAKAITRGVTAGTLAGGGQATEGANLALSGGIQKKFAMGGFVSSPTRALVGEDGPEVVIPLGAGKEGRRDALMGQAGLGGMNVSIGDIVINGGSNLSIAEVRALMSNEMPRVIRQELLRGARGVI